LPLVKSCKGKGKASLVKGEKYTKAYDDLNEEGKNKKNGSREKDKKATSMCSGYARRVRRERGRVPTHMMQRKGG